MVQILDAEVGRCVEAAWAQRTKEAYRPAISKWVMFMERVGLSRTQLFAISGKRREIWAVRFQAWLMLQMGQPPKFAAQTTYRASAALRGLGYGSLFESKDSRVGLVAKGALKRLEWACAGDNTHSGAAQGARVRDRPLTTWELQLLCNYWRATGEEGAGWADILTVIFYAAWRPSQYVKPAQDGAQRWRKRLVRLCDIKSSEQGLGWVVRDQKTGVPFKQFYFRGGPAQDLIDAVERLRARPAGQQRGTRYLCGWPGPKDVITYELLLMRWQQGLKAVQLAEGVNGPYALRRGGATFYARLGISWQDIAAANGWASAVVKRYILPDRWLPEPALKPDADD